VHDDALRTRLLEAASRVVADAGPTALTVRDVAARAGTSASAVYALFGGREELVRAVGEEAVRRFGAHLAAAPRTPDPDADLLDLGLAYRSSALDDPHFYRVMFDTAGAGARATSAASTTAQPTFRVLVDAVARVLRAHGAPPAVADRAAVPAALTLWGLVHGLVGLELSGLLPGDEHERAERFGAALRAAGSAIVTGAAQSASTSGAPGTHGS
jgi:AcrR family transcriptional regulator